MSRTCVVADFSHFVSTHPSMIVSKNQVRGTANTGLGRIFTTCEVRAAASQEDDFVKFEKKVIVDYFPQNKLPVDLSVQNMAARDSTQHSTQHATTKTAVSAIK